MVRLEQNKARPGLSCQTMQVLTVLIWELGRQRLQLAAINEAFSPGDFFRA
jgi:hypothetical protein